MKQTILLAALGLAAFGASAQEFGNVISSTPVIQQVAVPRQVCQPGVAGPTTGGGAVVGGLTGAGIGSAIGAGSGNAAAIAAGTIIGAIVGNNVEAQNQRYAYPQCFTENVTENRTVGYDVVYEYRGQQYSARMPYDPGRSVQLQVAQAAVQAAPAGNGAVVTAPPVQQAQAPQAVVGTAPAPVVAAQQPTVIVQQPAQVVYAPYPAYAYPYPYYRPYVPFGVSLGFVVGGHRHWR
jgi:uncharacterized protein YcfJ